jgi:hypothetical protein
VREEAITRRLSWVLALAGLLAAAALAGLATPAGAHPERPVSYPTGGKVPKLRFSGRARVVCKRDSGRRIRRVLRGRSNRRLRRRNLQLLRKCRYRHIQEAVNRARNNERILVLPGVYREEPSRRVPNPDPRCKDLYVKASGKDQPVPSYEYEARCPNSRNLIAILGDTRFDRDTRCDRKCNIQIQGTGRWADQVQVVGDQSKQNVFKADRADGVVFYNMTAQFSDYNNFYVLETDGFRYEKIISRWSREYGFLSFVSDHGLYQNLNAYGAGDAGVYPGSGPDTPCGITLRRVNSHHNLQGNSGSASDNLCFFDNDFHHNGVGVVVDSFSTGHPNMPQNGAVWRGNRIYSNNEDHFTADRDAYCKRPYVQRDPKVVCPAILVPIGTGLLIAGGNDNLIEGNRIYDNWRYGTMLFFVESTFRGDDPPKDQFDTSHGNRHLRNVMGERPGGQRDPNGTDFWWDEAGARNCWEGNRGPGGSPVTSNPGGALLPACPGVDVRRPVNPVKHSTLVPCAFHDEQTNTDPAGCDWQTLPSEPR